MTAQKEIKRPALRYHGGKFRLAPWIISHFPEHTHYVEPYGGAMSVLLRKTPSFIETYNDLNRDVVTFFRVLRERRDELLTKISLTPYSREEFLLSQNPATDELEIARRLYVWSCQGRGRAGVAEPGGWRFMTRRTRESTPSMDFKHQKHLFKIADRLQSVQIENDDALKVIKRYDSSETLFYVDPPYVQQTRGIRWNNTAYRFDMNDNQHCELAGILHSVQGKVILSGYWSALYDELYHGWRTSVRKAAKGNGVRQTIECLWLSW